MDNLLLPGEETSAWSLQDWRWDPFKMEAEPSERSKPARSRSQRGPVVCQVDGCGADLTGLKEYHQRYKICEYHLKVSSIIKDAVQQRFCQQCGRFHVLSEFDGVKRSCRARLERHNARRRKKSETHSRRSPTTLAPSALQGAKEESKGTDSVESQYDVEMSQYEMDDMFQASQAMVEPILPPGSMCMDTQEPPCMEGGKQDALMQLEQMFYESTDVDQSQSPSMMMGNDAMHLDPREGLSSDEGDPIAEVFRNFSQSSEARDLWNAMQSSVSRHDSQSSSSVCQGQVLMPQRREVLPGRPVLEPVPMLAPPVGSQYGGQGMLSMGVSQSQDMKGSESHFSTFVGQLRSTGMGAMSLSDARQPDADVSDSQRQDMMDDRGTAALYDSLLKLTSLSVKVFNCTPANLPAPLRRELLGAVRGGLVPEGYMRPGCVHLTIDVRHERTHELTCEDVVEHLLRDETSSFWKNNHFLVQLADCAAIVKDGVVIQTVKKSETPEVFPQLSHARPICVLNRAGAKCTLTGSQSTGAEDSVFFRHQGRHLSMAYESNNSGEGTVECSLLEDCPSGTLRINTARHNVLTSDCVPILALDNEDAVSEVRQLQDEEHTESAIQSILLNLGMVVEFRDWLLKRYTPGYSKPSKEAATREYSSEEMQKICIVGDQLLAFACGKGWEALVKILLPVALFSVYVAKASSCAHALESGEKTKEVDSGPKPVGELILCPLSGQETKCLQKPQDSVPCHASGEQRLSCRVDKDKRWCVESDHHEVFSVADKAREQQANRVIMNITSWESLQDIKKRLKLRQLPKHLDLCMSSCPPALGQEMSMYRRCCEIIAKQMWTVSPTTVTICKLLCDSTIKCS